ncbi:MAG: polymer-forming cytoskeletal protein [Myxococcota bacterium]
MADGAPIGSQDLPEEAPASVLLASGGRFDGLWVALSAARIEGRVSGQVRATGPLEIGPEAMVEGDLEVESLVVAGQVRGVIRARARVELRASAVVEGEIHAPGVAIAEGCRVDARCCVDATARSPQPMAPGALRD